MLGFGKWARRTYGAIIFAMTVIMLTTPLFANNGVLDESFFDHLLPGGVIRNPDYTLHARTTGSTSYTKAEYNPRRGTVQLTNVSEDGSAEVTGSRRAEWIDDRTLSSDEREHLYEEAQMTQKRLNDLYESGITGQRALDRLEEGTIIGVLNDTCVAGGGGLDECLSLYSLLGDLAGGGSGAPVLENCVFDEEGEMKVTDVEVLVRFPEVSAILSDAMVFFAVDVTSKTQTEYKGSCTEVVYGPNGERTELGERESSKIEIGSTKEVDSLELSEKTLAEFRIRHREGNDFVGHWLNSHQNYRLHVDIVTVDGNDETWKDYEVKRYLFEGSGEEEEVDKIRVIGRGSGV